ncbi:MAG: hypothetical protein ABJ059_16510, partial [Hyphomicrobiales bacterium]
SALSSSHVALFGCFINAYRNELPTTDPFQSKYPDEPSKRRKATGCPAKAEEQEKSSSLSQSRLSPIRAAHVDQISSSPDGRSACTIWVTGTIHRLYRWDTMH